MALGRKNKIRDLTNDPLTTSKLDLKDPPTRKRARRLDRAKNQQGIVQVGRTGIGESQFDKNISLQALADLGTIRAAKQPWHHQAANMLGQAVVGEIIGGTVEGLGYITDIESMYDLIKGQETEWGNALSDMGKSLREQGQEKLAIYQSDPGTFNPSDTGWWFGNGVSVASTLSLMIPAMGATKALSFLGKGLSKGAGMINKSLDIASKMGAKSKWISTGLTQAVTSRHMENMMEASGTFNEKFEEYKAKGMDENVARELASEAASFNYNTGWAMLLQDIPQYLLIGKVFNPITGKVQSKLAAAGAKGVKPGYVKKALIATAAYGSEGFEEGYQFAIAEEGKHKSDLKAGLIDESTFESRMKQYLKNGEFWTSVTFGALGAAVFQSVGPGVGELFKSKKQKEATRNFLKNKEEIIKNNGMNAALMHDMVAEADQSGSKVRMRAARRAVNLSVTIDAIEADGLDTHLETLNNLRNISEEEVAKLEEQGVEVNKDILQEMIPELVEQSVELNNTYMNLAKNHNVSVARNMAINKMHIKNFSKSSKEYLGDYKKIKGEFHNIDKVTSAGNKLFDSAINMQAYKRANSFLKDRMKKNPDKANKAIIQKQIDENNSLLKQEEMAYARATKDDNRTSKEKRLDTRIRNQGLADVELSNKVAGSILSDRKIDQYSDELVEMSTPEYSKRIELEETKRSFKQLNNKQDIENAIVELNKKGDQTFDDPKDKETVLKALEDRLRSIKLQEEREAAKKAQAEIIKKKKDINPKSIKKEQNPDGIDHVEDPNGDLDVDDTPTIKKQDDAVQVKGGATNFLRILDSIGSPLFQKWLANGRNKIGLKVEYAISTEGLEEVSDNAKEALKEFEAAKSIDDLSDFVFDWLPIQATFDGNTDMRGFIGDASQRDVELSENQVAYDQSEALERRRIITKLFNKEAVVTTIGKQLGGGLITDVQIDPITEEELNPNNNILDLDIDATNVGELEIYFSNEIGALMDEDKLTHIDMDFTMLVKDPGDNGETMAYAGGIFLKVQRANGFNFPLRLNMAKSTATEAETLADLMIASTILRTIKYTDTLQSLKDTSPALYKKITTEHKLEVDLLGKEGTVHDFIQTFVYMNDNTKGLNSALHTDKNEAGEYIIAFGQGFTLDTKTAQANKKDLVSFLINDKRRQLSRKQWSKRDNQNWKRYREYLVSNNILSTNAITKKPLFQKTKERPINLYAKSVKGEELDNTVAEREERTDNYGVKRMGPGNFHAAYYDPSGKEILVYTDTAEQAKAAVQKKYTAEMAGEKIPVAKKEEKGVNPNQATQKLN